jgi:hypothetical protein
MNKEKLHTLRLIIPGLLFLIILLLLIKGNQGIMGIKISSEDLIYLLFVFGIGSIYYVINPRMLLMKEPLQKINGNIRDKLLAPFSEDPQIKNSTEDLRKGDKLMNVYYHFIDNDESLKERAKEVFLNGLIWSSMVDLTFISLLGAIIFLVTFMFTKNSYFVLLTVIFVVVCIMMLLLTPNVVKKHIGFSNYQLGYITDIKKKELHDQLIALL